MRKKMGVRRHAPADFKTGTVYWQKLVTSLLGSTGEGKTLCFQGIWHLNLRAQQLLHDTIILNSAFST
jgi:hypothetical protein